VVVLLAGWPHLWQRLWTSILVVWSNMYVTLELVL
jgi:hypothetical protein